MKQTYTILTMLLAASLLLSACTGAAPTPTRAPAGAPAPAAAAVVRESNIRNFTLETFTVNVGTKVTWTNQDSAQHTSTAGVPGRIDDLWDSDIMDQGKQVSFTFTQAGTFPYWCRIHPQMTGVVTVR